jgi:hypothetical protein
MSPSNASLHESCANLNQTVYNLPSMSDGNLKIFQLVSAVILNL